MKLFGRLRIYGYLCKVKLTNNKALMKRIELFISLVMALLVYPAMSATAQDRTYTFEFNMEANIEDPNNPKDVKETMAPVKVTLIDDKDIGSPFIRENIKIESEDRFYQMLLKLGLNRALSKSCYIDPSGKGYVFLSNDSKVMYMFLDFDGSIAFAIAGEGVKTPKLYFSNNKNEENVKVFKKLKNKAETNTFYGYKVEKDN